MHVMLVAALLTGAAPGAAAADHVVRVDHPAGAVDARYRGRITIAHRQVGAASPGGRPSTLRCHWRADLAVDRVATLSTGTATRSFGRDAVLAGTRPGWCETSRAAIARDVAARADEVHGHLRALAREDHAPLRADLDRLHAVSRAG